MHNVAIFVCGEAAFGDLFVYMYLCGRSTVLYNIFSTFILYAQYDAGELKVYLDGIDYNCFEKWFSILQLGKYNHTATMGFETYKLRKYPRIVSPCQYLQIRHGVIILRTLLSI